MIMIQTRRTDEKFLALFSVSHPFSEHLTKREDDQLRDKYDHNAFSYQGSRRSRRCAGRWRTRRREGTVSSSWRDTRRWRRTSGWSGKKR